MAKLSDICTITSSKRIFRSEYQKEGVPFYRGREIIEKQKGKTKLTAELFISESKFNTIKDKFGAPTEGDLLLTSVGTIGVPYVVKSDDNFYFKDGNLTWFKDFKGVDSSYLYYWLLSPTGKGQLKKATIGTSQSALTIVLLKRLEIELPELSQQNKVAKILRDYDELIENNSKRIEKLESVARMLYDHYFSVPESVDWEVKPINALIASHIGGGWGSDSRSDEYTEPAFVMRGTDVPPARVGNIKEVPFRWHKASNLKSRALEPGDIVFEVSGGSKGQPLGRSMLISRELLDRFDRPVMCASFCKRISPNKELLVPEILYLSFIDAYYNGEIETYSVQSTGISNFKWTEYIERVTRKIPPYELQLDFRSKVGPIFSQITILGKKNSILKQSRDILLPRLISGELEV